MVIYGLVAILGALCSLCSAMVLHQYFGVDVQLSLGSLIGFGGAAAGLAIWNLYDVFWLKWNRPSHYAVDVAVVLAVAAFPFLPVAIQALA